jgi:hypothetical protein
VLAGALLILGAMRVQRFIEIRRWVWAWNRRV